MEIVILTYKDLAKRLNIKPQSARKLAQRKKWMRSAGNDGTARVHVPIEAFPVTSDKAGGNPQDSHRDMSHPVHELQKQVAVLETELKHAAGKIGSLETQCADLKTDRDAWRDQAQKKKSWFWRRVG